MPWDRKRLLGYVETIQLILEVTDKILYYIPIVRNTTGASIEDSQWKKVYRCSVCLCSFILSLETPNAVRSVA